MPRGDGFQSPTYPKHANEETIRTEDVDYRGGILSPGFLSAAAMAGWDEEALLHATLIVEDTPERESKHKKRLIQQFRTPPSTNSRRKRRSQRQTPPSISPIGAIILDDDEKDLEADGKAKKLKDVAEAEEKKKEEAEGTVPTESSRSDSASVLPCMDRLREELSCAICLEICFEPSTTSCGHSFCKKCLKSAADKCGKRCPKCRQLISNGRSCTVNTVLWNTIQLLFPEEIEARKAAMTATNNRQSKDRSPKNGSNSTRSMPLDSNDTDSNGSRRRRWGQRQVNASSTFENNIGRRRTSWDLSQQEDPVLAFSTNSSRRRMRISTNQEDDATLAFRLQREEFVEAFGETHEHEQPSSSFISARANLRAMASAFVENNEHRQPSRSFTSARASLRAMASRAIHVRLRGHPT